MKKHFLKTISAFLAPFFCFTMITQSALAFSGRSQQALSQWNQQKLHPKQKNLLHLLKTLVQSHRYVGKSGKKQFLKDYFRGFQKIQHLFQVLLAQTSDQMLLKSFHALLGKKKFQMFLKKVHSVTELRRKLFTLTTKKWILKNTSKIQRFLKNRDPQAMIFSFYRKAASKSFTHSLAKAGRATLAVFATILLVPVGIAAGIPMGVAFVMGLSLAITIVGLPLTVMLWGTGAILAYPSVLSIKAVQYLWTRWV